MQLQLFGGSIRASVCKARPPTKVLFHNNSYARDDQGGNPGQVIESSTVSSKICDHRWHHD